MGADEGSRAGRHEQLRVARPESPVPEADAERPERDAARAPGALALLSDPAAPAPGRRDAGSVEHAALTLQRTAGNRAVTALVQRLRDEQATSERGDERPAAAGGTEIATAGGAPAAAGGRGSGPSVPPAEPGPSGTPVRAVQRQPDPAPADAGGRRAIGSLDDVIRAAPLIPYEPSDDIVGEVADVALLTTMIAGFHWDSATTGPPELFHPKAALIWTDNKRVMVDPDGNPLDIADAQPRKDQKGAYLVQPRTGRTWMLYARAGAVQRVEEANPMTPQGDEFELGESALVIALPGVVVTPQQEQRLLAAIHAGKVAAKRAAGPPRWAKDSYAQLEKRRKASQDKTKGTGAGTGASGDGPGAGAKGTGTGGGGTADKTTPGAEGGSGRAPGTDGGDGTKASDASAPGPPPGTPGVDRPYTEAERRHLVTTKLTMDSNGDPVVTVAVDQAKGTVKLREGEDVTHLEHRVAQKEQELADARDPTKSIGIAKGAKETSITKPGPAGSGGGKDVTADAKASGARGDAAPGEMLPGAGIANYPPYPSRLELYGVGTDATKTFTTVVGATNQAAMIIDRGSDVLDIMRTITYSWELIDVTGKTPEAKAAAPSQTGFHKGGVIDRWSGQDRNRERTQEYIREDIEAESWATRAATWQVLGLSAAVRTIGSVISSWVSILTQPENERSIGWGKKGEFILRAVASPAISERAKADPEHHAIRGSSIKCIPMRVAEIRELATEANDEEQSQLALLEKQLAAAKADPKKADDVPAIEAQIKAFKAAMHEGTVAHLGSDLKEMRRQLRWCEILVATDPKQLTTTEGSKAIRARWQLDEGAFADLLEFAVGLAMRGMTADSLQSQLKSGVESLEKQQSQAAKWSLEIAKDYRPRMTLVSEESGQAIPLRVMLGEAALGPDASKEGRRHWILYDVTSDTTQKRYHGYSSKEGNAGIAEAIRNAFVDFRENAEYGRGSIAIRLPAELHEDLGFTVPVDPLMRAAPGATARWMQRLKDIATAAAVAGLVLMFVTGAGAALLAVGVIGGLAGGAVAIHSMMNRAEGDRLKLDFETFMDILAIIGAVASVVGPIASVAADVGKATVVAAREAGDVAKVFSAAKWVQRAEMTSRGLHIFGLLQNIGQVVIQIPYDIIREFEAIDKEERENPKAASPGQRRARRAMALLNGFYSGAIGIATLGQSLKEPGPRVTSDAEIWANAAEAASKPPSPASGHEGAPSPTHGPAPAGQDRPTVPGDQTSPKPAPAPADDSTPTGPRRIPVDPPAGVGGEGRHGPGDAPPDKGGRGGDHDGPTGTHGAPTGGPAHGPSGPPSRPLSADQLVQRVRSIVTADRSAPPPTGRIRVVEGATFTAQTGHPAEDLAVHDATGRDLIINRDALHAINGLPERLQAVVEARAHSLARRGLGDPLSRALMRRVVGDVFGEGSGLPTGTGTPIGDQVADLLQGAIGSGPLLDALFHGEIGTVRDRLNERFGATRSDAILGAARAGSTAELAQLMAPERTALAESYGPRLADGVGELMADHGTHHGPDSPGKALAKELVDAAGVQAVRDAFYRGDVEALDRALDAKVGPEARQAFTDRLRAGDLRGAGHALAEGAAAQARPATVPPAATAASTEFVTSLSGSPEGSAQPARRLLADLHDFKLVRKLLDAGALGGREASAAAGERLQAARMQAIDQVLAKVKQTVEERIPGVKLRFQDLGTPGLGSDRDVTMVAEPAKPGAEIAPSDLVRASTEAVRDAYDRLRAEGFDPDAALDTNFYTELHEGAFRPADVAERRAISADQNVVSLMEIAIYGEPAQFAAVRDAQLAAIDASDAPAKIKAETRARLEQQFVQAERRAAAISEGGREAGLRRARERLEDALQRTPPASAREIRQLMAEVKLLEPDAYGTRAAVEGVVHGQQGLARAKTAQEQQGPRGRVGPAERTPEGLTEALEHRLQQARAALAHLLGHLPSAGKAAPRDVAAAAKQLNRIAHAFDESGLRIDSPLLDGAGGVVAAKAEAPDAIVREVRAWAERSGQRFPNDEALLNAYLAEAQRLALKMTSQMGATAETMRAYEIGPSAELPEPPAGGPAEPPSPGGGPSGSGTKDGGEGGTGQTGGGSGEGGGYSATKPAAGQGGAGGATGDGTAKGDGAAQGDGRREPAKGGAPGTTAPSRPPAERPNGQRPAHEVAHEQFLERLRSGLTTPFEAPPSDARPLPKGEVGRYRSVDKAYEAFRQAVARSNGREVGLFYNPDTGAYAVVVGNTGSVRAPDTGGPWDCPLHTHPNPEQVLTYRMPAPHDVFEYWRTSLRTGRPAVGFVEYELPDGRRGQSRIEVHPDGQLLFEWPDADGTLRQESMSNSDYQQRWDARTRYVEPGSPQYHEFLRDIDDYRRDHPADDDGFSATKPAPRQKGIEGEGARLLAQADSPAFRRRLGYVRRRLRSWRADVVAAGADGPTLNVIGGLEQELARIQAGGQDGSVHPESLEALQRDITEARARLRLGARQTIPEGRQDYEVRLPMDDPPTKGKVMRWFEAETVELMSLPGGEHLRRMMLAKLAKLDEMVLMQSPRQSGVGAADTGVMRNRVREWITRGRYQDGGDLAEAFRANLGPDGWPVTADGRAWEVDHVLELWAGGTDTPDNYLPLHPDVHAIKSEILARFRRLYRDQARVDDEQADGRAGADAKFDQSER